jgi:hypothetical protein
MMSGQEVHPGNCDRFMVKMRHVVVRGECLHARTDSSQCLFKGLTVQVNPRQAQVVGMPELRIIQAARMKCFEEIVIIQVSRCECERHIQLSQPNRPGGKQHRFAKSASIKQTATKQPKRQRHQACAGFRPARNAFTCAGEKSSHQITGTSAIRSFARGFDPQMAVHQLTVAASEHRNFEAELADAVAHAIDDSVISAGIPGAQNQAVNGPDLDFESRGRDRAPCLTLP